MTPPAGLTTPEPGRRILFHLTPGKGRSVNCGAEPPPFDITKPHPARVYDFLLGGKDNYAIDREAAEKILAVAPELRANARANRTFLSRAVRYLAGERGIRQFLDIGTGIPAAGNTHEVAQAAAPESRIVYVDNDPVVLAHARALLTSDERGATEYIEADIRDPEKIIARARDLLDFNRPVALLLVAVLHFIADADDPAELVAAYRDALPGVILSFRVSRGCELRHRVRTLSLTRRRRPDEGASEWAGLLPDRVRAARRGLARRMPAWNRRWHELDHRECDRPASCGRRPRYRRNTAWPAARKPGRCTTRRAPAGRRATC